MRGCYVARGDYLVRESYVARDDYLAQRGWPFIEKQFLSEKGINLNGIDGSRGAKFGGPRCHHDVKILSWLRFHQIRTLNG